MATFANKTKNSASYDNKGKAGLVKGGINKTWNEATETWEETEKCWEDSGATSFNNKTKNPANFTNKIKN